VIWLTWRQQRTETLIAVLLLALVAALLVPTGLQMTSAYEHDGIAACLADRSADCRARIDAFDTRWSVLLNFVGWLNLVPGLIGVLLAAHLVLEFERGTFRLAWTQSITRGRWLTVRLALIAGAALATSLVLTALMTWWHRPFDDLNGRFADGFDLEGVVPSAYTVFARMGLQPRPRVPGRRRAAARPRDRGGLRHRQDSEELRRRVPRAARHRRVHVGDLSPGEQVLALPGRRSGHLHRPRRRAARLLRLVDPQADQLRRARRVANRVKLGPTRR
jgi:hypothetical protein